MKKISLCFLMVVCLIMQSICIVSADAFDQVDGSKFAITIQSESSNVDLSGITIDVYTAQVAFADVSVGHYEYDEEYSFSVVTGKNGKVTFERPSEYFSITVRMETLPKNYGIDNHTRFFTRDINEYIGNIYEIASVDIDDDAGEVVPILYGKNGNIIYAEASVEIIPKGNSKQVYRVDQDAKSISHINEINVSVYDNIINILKMLFINIPMMLIKQAIYIPRDLFLNKNILSPLVNMFLPRHQIRLIPTQLMGLNYIGNYAIIMKSVAQFVPTML